MFDRARRARRPTYSRSTRRRSRAQPAPRAPVATGGDDCYIRRNRPIGAAETEGMGMSEPKREARRANPMAATKEAQASPGLSIVVPLYNEADGLAQLHARIAEVARSLADARGLGCEVVYVDDGSRDATLAVARALPAEGLDVQVVALSRNFGKEAALLAGLEHARGGAVLFMDGDGQHPPVLIETLVAHWLDDGYDVVYTAKANRTREPVARRLGVRAFYAVVNWGARQKIPVDAGDFRLLSPRAAAALRQLPERNRFFKGLASWIGFRQIRVEYLPTDRDHGRTSWSARRLIGLSIDGLTSFSVAPLRLASLLGLILAATALLFGGWMVLEAFLYERTVPGYPSLIVGLMVLGGVQLVMIGVVGEYIGKILYELKARPVYFVAEHQLKNADDEEHSRAAATRTAAE
jgi:glycosyltransferase involved in cell wall biosynthesis